MTREQFWAKCLESGGSWGGSHEAFKRVVQKLGLRRGVEIGVGYGGNAATLLPILDQLVGVDPFRHDPSYKDVMNVPQAEFDSICRHVIDRLHPFGNFVLLRLPSEEAVKVFRPGQVDFVYVDGDHREEAVRRDLALWVPIVRPGGIIAGHDFDHPSHPGVARAVLDVLGEVHLEDNYVWWTVVP